MAKALLLGVLFLIGCGRSTVPLLKSAGVPLTPTPSGDIPLEVVTRSTDVRDPVPVSGSRVSYAEMEAALGHAVSSAAVPWAQANRKRRPGGWQLYLEIISADVEHTGGRLIVSMTVRSTLRGRMGTVHIAQGETGCRDAGLVPAENGAPVVYSCMMRIGRDVVQWLSEVEPDPALAPPPAPAASGTPIGPAGDGPAPDGDGDGDGAGGDSAD
jgi:hypothetical protein